MTLEKLTGKERLTQLIGNHQSSPRFVRGVYDAGRLQYATTRVDGRKADIMRNLIGTEHEYAGSKTINTIVENDRRYKKLKLKQQNIERSVKKVSTNAAEDRNDAQYHDGFRMAQSVLGQYVAEDRSLLLGRGEKIASVYPMFINGTMRFFRDLSEVTHKWKISNASRRTMLFFSKFTK